MNLVSSVMEAKLEGRMPIDRPRLRYFEYIERLGQKRPIIGSNEEAGPGKIRTCTVSQI